MVFFRFLSSVPDCPRRLVGCCRARPTAVGPGSRSVTACTSRNQLGVCPACALPLAHDAQCVRGGGQAGHGV